VYVCVCVCGFTQGIECVYIFTVFIM